MICGYRPEDRDALAKQLGPVLSHLYPDDADWLTRRLDDLDRHEAVARIAKSHGRVDGVTIETPKSRRRVKLSTIWVAENRRRQGLGAALIDDRRADWLARGIREASLTARATVAPSLAKLLLPRGFEVVTVEADRYGKGQDEVIFQWRSKSDPGVATVPGRRLRWARGRLTENDPTGSDGY